MNHTVRQRRKLNQGLVMIESKNKIKTTACHKGYLVALAIVIEQTHPIVQVAIGTVIAVIMTAVFFGFLVGTQS